MVCFGPGDLGAGPRRSLGKGSVSYELGRGQLQSRHRPLAQRGGSLKGGVTWGTAARRGGTSLAFGGVVLACVPPARRRPRASGPPRHVRASVARPERCGRRSPGGKGVWTRTLFLTWRSYFI